MRDIGYKAALEFKGMLQAFQHCIKCIGQFLDFIFRASQGQACIEGTCTDTLCGLTDPPYRSQGCSCKPVRSCPAQDDYQAKTDQLNAAQFDKQNAFQGI